MTDDTQQRRNPQGTTPASSVRTQRDGLRPRAFACVVLAIAAATAGCSDFFSAEVTGFLKRARVAKEGESTESGPGVNGVEVRMYFDEPESFDDPGFVAHTTSIDNRSAGVALPGFYRANLAWETSSPDFGDSGDRRTVWIATRHADYADSIVEFDAVVSNSINVTPEIVLQGLRTGPERVIGQVRMDDMGVNGVRVVLSLHETATTFETRSGTVDDQPGVYVFDDVRWDAEDGNTRGAVISVDDQTYLLNQPTTIDLVADETVIVTEPLSVRLAYFYAKRIWGRVVDRLGHGVDGVRVEVRPEQARYLGIHASTVTAGVDGESGIYQFVGFGWPLPASATALDTLDTQRVFVKVQDDAYQQDGQQIELPVDIALQQEVEVATDIVVSHAPRSTFSAVVRGRCVENQAADKTGAPHGVAGVEVTATYSDDTGAHTIVTRADLDGSYDFPVEWTRERPDESAPFGEDDLALELGFSPITRMDGESSFDSIAYVTRSWVRPNYVPDAVAREEVSAPDGGP